MTYWTRQSILRKYIQSSPKGYAEKNSKLKISEFYTNRFPSRGDARIITDNETGTWTMWICYGNGHQHNFDSPRYMPTEQAALNYALDLLREDARGNLNLDYETVDSNDSENSDYEEDDEKDDEEGDEDDDEDSEDPEGSDDDNLHNSDSEDPGDQGEYGRASFSDDEEDFDQRNNYGNSDSWDEPDDSGFKNGAGQLGSYGYHW